MTSGDNTEHIQTHTHTHIIIISVNNELLTVIYKILKFTYI